jgi:peptide deformylase
MKIVEYPHPALRYPARPLTAINEKVRTQARKMLDLMYEAKGLGLASNQVALPYQLLVINPTADPTKTEEEKILVNPVITERKGTMEGEEGCLSFPNLYAKVRRAKTIRARAYNLKGELVDVAASDLPSRLIQHEVDHLHGILFIDKLGPIARLSARGSIKEFERKYRRAQEKGDIPADLEIKKLLDALAAEA